MYGDLRMPDILLVEDDASLQRSMEAFFGDCGFSTAAATTLGQARKLVRSLQPRLCILDLNLPDGSGLDVLRMIVQQELAIRVIVLTALPVQHLRERYPGRTLVEWITKPTAPQTLLEAVRRCLEEGRRDAQQKSSPGSQANPVENGVLRVK